MVKATKQSVKTENNANFQRYTIGLVFSILMTVVPYLLVTNQLISGWQQLMFLVLFAVLQVYVQLEYFLHIGDEKKPRFKLMVFAFMMIVVVIVVAGSVWIMDSLNYHKHSMTPDETDTYIIQDEGLESQNK